MNSLDPQLLLKDTFFDTGVLFRALGAYRDDPRQALCEQLFRMLVDMKKTVLVGAPTIAEYLRGEPAGLPSTAGMRIVAFTNAAALHCGRTFPRERIALAAEQSKKSGNWLKFDFQIISCAVVGGAKAFVTIDADQAKHARAAGLNARDPTDFLGKQPGLF